MALHHEKNFDAIMTGFPSPIVFMLNSKGQMATARYRFHLSLRHFVDSRPSKIDAHVGDGIYVIDFRPGSMKKSEICRAL